MHDGRWTAQGDGRQPRAIGHRRDSIDLKDQITYDFSLFNKHPPIMHVVKNHNFTIFYIHNLFKIFLKTKKIRVKESTIMSFM